MKAIVKQDFDYSRDGLTIVRLRAGEIHEISDKVAPGLMAAGLIAGVIPEAPQAEPAPVAAPIQPVQRSRFEGRRR